VSGAALQFAGFLVFAVAVVWLLYRADSGRSNGPSCEDRIMANKQEDERGRGAPVLYRRVHRTLSLRVGEYKPVAAPHSYPTPGDRFATGWGLFVRFRQLKGQTDPVIVAGFLAARAAWDAYFNAVNTMEENDG
jgi:hypothetical protein